MRIKISESQVKRIYNILTEDSLDDKLTKFSDMLGKYADLYGADLSSSKSTVDVSKIDIGNSWAKNDAALNFPNKIDILPVPDTAINSPFGPRNIGAGKSKNHQGVDLRATSGTDVIAVANGVVVSARDTTPNGCGGFVKIKHEDYETKYCHLKQWFVKEGEAVKKGQIIGKSGGAKTDPFRGNSDGAHLHYEVWKGGRPLDPMSVHSDV